MNPIPPEDSDLTRFVDRTLRALPPRPAPLELRRQVFAELTRRAALPWWRQSFLGWPIWARVALVGVCLLAGRLIFGVTPHLAAPMARPLGWLQIIGGWFTYVRSLFDYLGGSLLHSVPTFWLYGGALVLLVLYTSLAGLGALAYRTLYASR